MTDELVKDKDGLLLVEDDEDTMENRYLTFKSRKGKLWDFDKKRYRDYRTSKNN